MIALVLSSAWPRYYASSPFNTLLKGSHPKFEVFGVLPHETADEKFRARINACEALVVDDVNAIYFDWYKGPKLMIGGDPHCHNQNQVERITKEYMAMDYVLTGAVFSKKLSPPYLYPSEEVRAKHVYFPHMVPDEVINWPDWEGREPRALLAGSMDKAVYPYRWRCRELSQEGAPITLLNQNEFHHFQFFEKLSKYKMAITCSSNFEYMVAKYVEIPWTGTILVAPRPAEEECELMGFREGWNALWCDNPDQIPMGIRQLSDPASAGVVSVAKAGQELMKSHTTYQRLDYITKLVERICKPGFKPEDAKDCFLNHRKGVPGDVPNERVSLE